MEPLVRRGQSQVTEVILNLGFSGSLSLATFQQLKALLLEKQLLLKLCSYRFHACDQIKEEKLTLKTYLKDESYRLSSWNNQTIKL